ncbi:MAG: hypothetical protein KC486_08670 [Myxococcales bacterium]|nr:hypothetical protein [Myxococcales bacterium]
MAGPRGVLVTAVWLGLGCACASQADAPTPPATDEGRPPAGDGADGAAAEDAAADERRAAVFAGLERRLADDPNNGAVLYVLARSAAAKGELEEALTHLERLAAIADWDHPLDPDDFTPLPDSARFSAVAEALVARAPAVTHGDAAMELDTVDLLPEGLTWDPKRGELLVGSMYRRQIFAADRQGRLRAVIPERAGGVLGVLGMDVDAARDQIWVAAVGAPFIPGLDADEASAAGIWGFDLATGAVVGQHLAPRTHAMLNDLVVLRDGAIVVTDSGNGSVLVRRPGAAALEELAPPDTFLGPNGIADAAEPGVVYVADFDGIHRIDVGSGERIALAAPEGVRTLGGIDGLDRQNDTLVGVQNVFTRGRIWAMTLADDGRSLRAARVLDDSHPRLDGATTGVFVAPGVFWYIANAGMQFSPSGLRPVEDDARHVILEVRLAEGGA